MSDPSAGKRKVLDDKKLSKGKRELGNESGQISPRDITKQNLEGEDDEDNRMDPDDLDHLEFEDPFGDEFEEEDFDADQYESDGNEDDEDDEVEDEMAIDKVDKQKKVSSKKSPNEDQMKDEEEEGAENGELEYDPTAYVMYHSVQMEWPCLSFDFIRDEYGDNRQRFPLSMLMVSGSQADRRERNKITLLKLSDVHKTKGPKEDADSDNDDNDDDDDDDDLDDDPTIEAITVAHSGCVNRIRAMPQRPGIVASMADTQSAHIFDLTASVRSMLVGGPRVTPSPKPAFTFNGHKDEGFAVDWSPQVAGRLATGDCSGHIHVWNAAANGSSWSIDTAPYRGHQGSVEDLQWSPSEQSVFISASTDRTVRVWDIRGKAGPQITFQAHDADVNVVSWNRLVNYLLASGSDDGSFKVWDLRAVRSKPEPVALFHHHKQPITSIEWAPHDESVLCLSSEDNQVTIWDLSVEADDHAFSAGGADAFPAQLLFVHQGQKEVKEVHYHPQIPGVIMSSAEEGVDVFKPAINVSS